MDTEKLSDAIGNIDEDIVRAADEKRKSGEDDEAFRRRRLRLKVTAAAAAACLVLGIGAAAIMILPQISVTENDGMNKPTSDAYEHVSADYSADLNAPSHTDKNSGAASNAPDSAADAPDNAPSITDSVKMLARAKYIDFKNDPDTDKIRNEAAAAVDKSGRFYGDITAAALKGRKENCAVSPMNVYMALAALCEATNGNTRTQLLSMLGADDIRSVRDNADNIFKAFCSDDDVNGTASLANSLWIKDSGVNYNTDTLDSIANFYHASCFAGDPADRSMTNMLHLWLKDNSGGFENKLSEKAEFSPDTVFSVYSTLYCKLGWKNKFDNQMTRPMYFANEDGKRMTVWGMNCIENGEIYTGKDCRMIKLDMSDGEMWLILPNKNSSVDEVLGSGSCFAMLNGSIEEYFTDIKSRSMEILLPKFDITYDLDLIGGIKSLGAEDVFGSGADFSALGLSGAYVDKFAQYGRVVIDEEGFTGTSYTEAETVSGCLDDTEARMIFDRPFIFVAVKAGLPAFIGTVYEPIKA